MQSILILGSDVFNQKQQPSILLQHLIAPN